MKKLILITGNKGKSIFSFYLANRLAVNNKKVIIVSSDYIKPTSYLFFPEKTDLDNKSIGKLLSLAVISKADIFNHCTIDKNADIGYLNYAPNENDNSYPEITKSELSNLYTQLNSLTDYIIVDTNSSQNKIDSFFADKKDIELCITTADYCGLLYRKQYNSTGINILLNDNAFNPLEDIQRTFDKSNPAKYILPESKLLTAIYNGYNIHGVTPTKKYLRVIDKIISEVIVSDE